MIMKKIILIVLISILFVFGTSFTEAQSPTSSPTPSSSSRLVELQKQIGEVEGKINDLQGQEKTLSSQIAVIDNQIKLTILKIDATKQQITDLTLDIDTADKKIGSIEKSLDNLTKVLVNRIQATYMVGSAPSFQVLMTSSDVSDFFERANYLRIAQAHDRRLIYDTVQAKNDYEHQKEIFEDKKLQIEALNKEFEAYTTQLGRDRGGKEELLEITQNDEDKFQQELARLKADAASISQALGNVGEKVGPVNKGDVIGGVGSSGCSTGPHLHFEVFTDAKVENGKVVGNRVDPKPYLENGAYEKPVPGYPGSVTTWYGVQYFLGVHTGIDIANPFGTPIRAMESGEAYATSATCSYNGSLGKGIIVDHKNGLVTLYWHLP